MNREQLIKIIKDAFTGTTKDGKVWCKPVDGVPEKIADAILALKESNTKPASLDECRLTEREVRDTSGYGSYSFITPYLDAQLHSPKLSAYIAAREEAARKEVVEWVERNVDYVTHTVGNELVRDGLDVYPAWQAQLKAWNVR